MFDHFGQLLFDKDKYSEDQVMEVALEAGADDVSESEGYIQVLTGTTDVYRVKEGFDKVGMHPESSGMAFIPKTTIKVDDKDTGSKLLEMFEELEDHDDVQKLHSNFEMDDSLLDEPAS